MFPHPEIMWHEMSSYTYSKVPAFGRLQIGFIMHSKIHYQERHLDLFTSFALITLLTFVD